MSRETAPRSEVGTDQAAIWNNGVRGVVVGLCTGRGRVDILTIQPLVKGKQWTPNRWSLIRPYTIAMMALSIFMAVCGQWSSVLREAYFPAPAQITLNRASLPYRLMTLSIASFKRVHSSGLFAKEAHLELTLFKSKRLAQREFASGIFKKEVNSIPRALTAYLVYCP